MSKAASPENQPEKEKIVLTKEQKDLIIKFWNDNKDNPPSLPDITQHVFNDPTLDGRGMKGRAVREFIATQNIELPKSYGYKPKGFLGLSEENKEYIANNASTMNALQLAKEVYKKKDLVNRSQETRTVIDYIKTLNPKDVIEDPMEEVYRPPKTEDQTIARINKYVQDALNREKLTPRQRKDVDMLRTYLHSYKFANQINSYSNFSEKELFESDFVKFTYDKNDLSQEELDLYILLCIEGVRSVRIQKRTEALQELFNQEIEAMRDDDTKKRIFNHGLVESLNNIETEYNQCVKRQEELIKNLVGKRSERINNQLKATASILNLVELWKFKESRDDLIKEAEKRKVGIKEELENLAGMDRIKAQIFGITEEESLN